MAQQGGNQNLPPSSLCRMGCGFYGNPMYDGMCSKCHKDALKRRQQTSSPTQMSGRASPLATACSVASTEKSASDSVSQTLVSSAASVETASPTVTTTPTQDKTKTGTEKEQQETGTESIATLASASDDTPADQDRKPKKNRCQTCKKKVGLTGFACRCGGLFCGMHRYSDKHDCSFNYKELAQNEIRKSNPVVVAEKIQKI